MTTIKSFTDLEQSKILGKILPPESADSVIVTFGDREGTKTVVMPKETLDIIKTPFSDIRETVNCWSLAALLDALRVFTMPTAFSVRVSTPSLIKTENGYKLIYTGDYTQMINNELNIEPPIESVADNPVDACYEIILKYHELNIL